MNKIRRFGVLSVGKVTGISGAFLGLIIGVLYGGTMILISGVSYGSGEEGAAGIAALGSGRGMGRNFRQLSEGGLTVTNFSSKRLPEARDDVAPDGSDVRVLLGLRGGGMAHFELAAGQTSKAVTHRTVEEIWFFLSGRGEMWRKQEEREEILVVEPGVCLTIPLSTHFQFRSTGDEPLAALGVTMPPWPGAGEAILVPGKWEPTVH